MTSTRVITAVALALLACLVAVAAALTSTSTTPPVPSSHLEVGAGPPSTVTGVLRYSDSSGIAITASVRADVANNAAQVVATATLSIVSASVTLRTVGEDAYLQVPGYASLLGAPWTEVRVPKDRGALGLFARELRHPQFFRLHPTSEATTTSPRGTTTTLRYQRVTVPRLEGLPLSLPRHGHLTVTIRTGSAGQVLSIAARLWTRTDTVRVSFVVTGYDQPVALAAPPASQVRLLDRARAISIFGSNTPSLARTLRKLGITFPP